MSLLSTRVTDWPLPARFFPWSHVQEAINGVDHVVYRVAMETAQEMFEEQVRACPDCGLPSTKLFWVCVDTPEATWMRGEGQVGFLTICAPCQRQVDFIVDRMLTELAAADRAATSQTAPE